MDRLRLVVLVVAFALTRLVTAFLADHPEHYGPPDTKVTFDVDLYANWASQMVDYPLTPYSELAIEYPPGSLPFMVVPELGRSDEDTYRTRFILLMLLVDAAGFAALISLARRWGSWLGPWLWVAAIPLLGPISYNRIDIVPAVATILALERLAAGRMFAGGGWLGLGALAKLYPVLLLPVAFAGSRRKDVLTGAALVGGVLLLPYIGSLDHVAQSVLGYHGQRGIQIESLWALELLVAGRFGYPITVNYSFGAIHVGAPAADLLKVAAFALSVATVAAGTWLAYRLGRRYGAVPAEQLAALLFATLAATIAVGSVFSPQYMIWIAALAAVALTHARCPIRPHALSVLPLALLTQLIYPFFYGDVLAGDPQGLLLLGLRNLGLVAIALGAVLSLHAAGIAHGSRGASEVSQLS